MPLPAFQYCLRADATNYYSLSGGSVITGPAKAPLTYPPMEWNDAKLEWGRDDKYAGIFRSFTIPLSFVNEGATILRHVKYTQGTEGKCFLEEWRLDDHTQQYVLFYSGAIDFSQSIDTEYSFQARILDNDLAALFSAYENTPQEIPVQDSDAKKVYLDGKKLETTYPFGVLIGSGNTAQTNTKTGINVAFGPQLFAYDTYALPYEGDIVTGTTQNTTALDLASGGGVGTGSSTPNNDFNYLSTSVGDVIVKIRQPVTYTNPTFLSSTSIRLSFRLLHWSFASGSIAHNLPLWTDPAGFLAVGATRNYTGTNPAIGSATITGVAKQDRLYVAYQVDFLAASGTSAFTVSLFDTAPTFYPITITTANLLTPGTSNWYSISQLWTKLIAALTSNGPYTARSDFFSNPSLQTVDNKPFNTYATCGDSIRGLKTDVNGNLADPKIKTTLDEFNQAMSSIYMTGIGVEGAVARLEHLSYFFDNGTTIATLPVEVTNFRCDVAKGYLFNQYKGGYQGQSYDAVNGKDEFNTEVVFGTPAIRVTDQINKQSTYRADTYGIEFERYNLSNKKTTDSGSDNDTFLVETSGNVNSSGAYTLAKLQNNSGNSATGILQAATAYNISLSPKRNMLRNAPLIATAMHLVTGNVTFKTSDKNGALASKLTSATGLVTEKDDVVISSLANPLFLPIIFTFDTVVPSDIATQIMANPYGRIQFKWRNRKTDKVFTLAGFIYQVSIHPADSASQTWKLLAAPDTNLSNLVF